MCASPPSMPLTGISFSTMLKEVHKHYPNISFTLTTINNIHIQQALISGKADFGIMLNPQTSRELQVRAFAEMNMGIVVPTGHPLASRSAVRFSPVPRLPLYPAVRPIDDQRAGGGAGEHQRQRGKGGGGIE